MARTVGAYEAKTHLSQLLDEVEQGETITITRHGRVVAILSQAAPDPREHNRKVLEELRKLTEQPGWPRMTREEIEETFRIMREGRSYEVLDKYWGRAD